MARELGRLCGGVGDHAARGKGRAGWLVEGWDEICWGYVRAGVYAWVVWFRRGHFGGFVLGALGCVDLDAWEILR